MDNDNYPPRVSEPDPEGTKILNEDDTDFIMQEIQKPRNWFDKFWDFVARNDRELTGFCVGMISWSVLAAAAMMLNRCS